MSYRTSLVEALIRDNQKTLLASGKEPEFLAGNFMRASISSGLIQIALLALPAALAATAALAETVLPLGDSRRSDRPAKGYVWACRGAFP